MENGCRGQKAASVPISRANGTTRPLSALWKRKGNNFQAGPSSKQNVKSSSMASVGRLWSFFVLGAGMFIVGIIVTALYFNIRALTSSLTYTEVIPPYIPAASMVVCGCSVMLLFWRRFKALVVVVIVACVITALLNTVVTVLTGTHVVRVLQQMSQCRYYAKTRACHCITPLTRNRLALSFSEKLEDFQKLQFEDTDSCESIQGTLVNAVYGLCAGYTGAVLLAVGAAILAGLVFRTEVTKETVQQDAYEEVYTVSGGSSVASESDNEQQQLPSPAAQPVVISPDNKPLNMGLRRSRSLCQPRESCLEESTDNLLTDTSIESSAAAARVRQKRRRHKRAMTLNHLDSKQLMLILSLQMRYLQESENLRDSRSQTPVASGRKTPNPGSAAPTNKNTANQNLVSQSYRREQTASVPPNRFHDGSCQLTPEQDQPQRQRSRSALAVEGPPDFNPTSDTRMDQERGRHRNQLPNTRMDYNANITGHIPDVPRYVSLPKLPRRSQTPQTVTNHLQNGSGMRIPSSTSDPNILQHSYMERPSKTEMLSQKQSQERGFRGKSYVHRGLKTPIPSHERPQIMPAHPTRIKTPDGNYAQVSHYNRSRSQAAPFSRTAGARPLPPVRSVSCGQNSLPVSRSPEPSALIEMQNSSREPSESRELHHQPSNYAEVCYETQSPAETSRGQGRRDDWASEGLYARPSKVPQIVLNEAYVDLYPVQDPPTLSNNDASRSGRSVQRALPPPPPPPYPAFLLPASTVIGSSDANAHTPAPPPRNVSHQNQRHSSSSNQPLTPGTERGPVPRHVLSHSHRHDYHDSRDDDSDSFPPPPPPLTEAVYDSAGLSQRHNTPSHAFRPINSLSHGRQSPPVRERAQRNVAVVLHNSDQDSDSDFMETVI